MAHVISPAVFDRVVAPHQRVDVGAKPLPSCCQQAVSDALDTHASTGSVGSVATVTMLASVAMLMVGFVFGLTMAWALF